MVQQAQAGEIDLAYVDNLKVIYALQGTSEAGFAPQPPNRSAWGKKGETHAAGAKRSRRLNVIGALLSSGGLVMAKLWQSVNGLYPKGHKWFFGFLMALVERAKKPIVVILDL